MMALDGQVKMAMDDQQLQVAAWASGWGIDSSLAEGQGFIGYAALSELAQRPEYRAIAEVIAYEMTREGVEFKTAGTGEDKSKKIAAIKAEWHRLGVMKAFAKAALYDAFMGRSHIFLDLGEEQSTAVTPSADVARELAIPIGDGEGELSRSKVSPEKPLKRLINVEPVWTYPTYYNSSNPLRTDWYKPDNWFVMGTNIHASRLLTFIGREVPDLLKPAYSFGGLSMSQMAMPYVQNWLRTRQAVADLIWSFTVFVLKTNLSESLQADGQQLFDRAEVFNNMRSNQGLMMLDKDLEDFSNVSASLSGLHELQAQTQEHMAAVSRIPIIKLLGIQPSGLNASSEGEIRAFYDWIHAYQESFGRDNLTRILRFIQLSLFGDVDPEITFEFKGLWQLDEAGQLAVLKTKADIDDANIAMGKITPQEARQREAEDHEGLYMGLDLSQPIAQPGEGKPALDPDGNQIYDPETDLPIMINPANNEPFVKDPALTGEMGAGQGAPGEGLPDAESGSGVPEVDPTTGQRREPSPGGTMHPRDPASRIATTITSKAAKAPMGTGASSLGGAESGIDSKIARDAARQIIWQEELHPRDHFGKFARKEDVDAGVNEALSKSDFFPEPGPEAHYSNPKGHGVSVLAPEGNEPAANWIHHESGRSGNGGEELARHLGSLATPAAEPEFAEPFSFEGPGSGPSIEELSVGVTEIGDDYERNDVIEYTGYMAEDVNNTLRLGSTRAGGYELNSSRVQTTETIKNVTNWLNQTSMMADVVCTRHLSESAAAKILGQATVGSVFTDKSFVSTSRTGSFTGDVMCVIKIPQGSKASSVMPLSINKSENEVLIQRNSGFRVVAFHPTKPVIYLELEQKHLGKRKA